MRPPAARWTKHCAGGHSNVPINGSSTERTALGIPLFAGAMVASPPSDRAAIKASGTVSQVKGLIGSGGLRAAGGAECEARQPRARPTGARRACPERKQREAIRRMKPKKKSPMRRFQGRALFWNADELGLSGKFLKSSICRPSPSRSLRVECGKLGTHSFPSSRSSFSTISNLDNAAALLLGWLSVSVSAYARVTTSPTKAGTIRRRLPREGERKKPCLGQEVPLLHSHPSLRAR